jgi:hypothetical protein
MRDPTAVDVEAAVEAARKFLHDEFFQYGFDRRAAEQLPRYWDAYHIAEAKDVPEDVRERVCQLLISHRGKRPTYALRDHYIGLAIRSTVERGFAPTRNDASRGGRASACSIVAEALGQLGIDLLERGVEHIWRLSRRRPGKKRQKSRTTT